MLIQLDPDESSEFIQTIQFVVDHCHQRKLSHKKLKVIMD